MSFPASEVAAPLEEQRQQQQQQQQQQQHKRIHTTTTRTPLLQPLVISGPSGTGKSTILSRLFATHPDTFGFSVSHTTRSPRKGEVDGQDYHFVSRDEFVRLRDQTPGFFIETAEFGGNLYGTSRKAVEDVAVGRTLGKALRTAAPGATSTGGSDEKTTTGTEARSGPSLDVSKGKCCVLDIEMEGVKQLRNPAPMPALPAPSPPQAQTGMEQLSQPTPSTPPPVAATEQKADKDIPSLNPRFLFLSPPSLEELERRLRSRATDSEHAIQSRLDQARREMEFASLPGSHDKIVVNDDLDRAYGEVEGWVMGGLEP